MRTTPPDQAFAFTIRRTRIGKKWQRQLVDPGGVAVEDAVAGDLNADGRPEIIAVGRATHNVRIYWNENKD